MAPPGLLELAPGILRVVWGLAQCDHPANGAGRRLKERISVDYKSISKDVIGHLYKAHHAIRVSEIDETLVALAELRVAQLVGCAYCCAFHSGELRQVGEGVVDGETRRNRVRRARCN